PPLVATLHPLAGRWPRAESGAQRVGRCPLGGHELACGGRLGLRADRLRQREGAGASRPDLPPASRLHQGLVGGRRAAGVPAPAPAAQTLAATAPGPDAPAVPGAVAGAPAGVGTTLSLPGA